MRRENHRFFGGHVFNQAADFVFLVGIEAIGRLVEDECGRVVDQCLCEADALFVTFRKRLDGLVADAVEMGESEDVLDPFAFCGRGAEAADLRDETEKFFHRHLGVSRRAFGEVAELAFYGDGVDGDVDAANGGRAGVGSDEAGEHLHRGRFAGAIGAEETEDLAAVYFKTNAVHGTLGAIVFNEACDFDHGLKRGLWEAECALKTDAKKSSAQRASGIFGKKLRQAATAFRRGSGRNAVNNPSSGRNEQT